MAARDKDLLVHGEDRQASRYLRDEGPGRTAGRLSDRQRTASGALRHTAPAAPGHRLRSMEGSGVAGRAARARGKLTKRERRQLAAAVIEAGAEAAGNDEAPESAPPTGRLARRAGRALRAARAASARGSAPARQVAGAQTGCTFGMAEPGTPAAGGPGRAPGAPSAAPREEGPRRPAHAGASRADRRRASRVRKIKARAALRGRARARVARAVASATGSTSTARAVRAAGSPPRALFALKPVLGAVAGAAAAALSLGLACVLVVALLAAGGSSSQQPPASSALPEKVELWRAEATAACQAIFGDAEWVDLVLAMMAQESGGNLSVLCYPGGVQRQDIMQACEGAFGSWIINGGGPHNLTACTPRASIYAGTAELKQNLDLWDGYLGGIAAHEVDKIKLVVQGYNFGARGWYNWNVRHGYTSYTLERAEAYSAAVMPAGAKGTPSHAEKVMQYYSWAAVGGADGSATVARAFQELGKPYLWGAVGPASYDCSGLVSYCLTGQHVRLGTTDTFQSWTRVVAPQPGDITLNSHHCGIYIGNGQMIHAPRTGDVVKISAVHPDMIYVRY